ncbi:RNA-binding transcriptional accessory protein [Leptolyngbyaceae cyanobacterium CCMR0082]|uniref:RNA-binding transcriptional accessory protein n=1 Tax=Adonisia turfae CCMR0082 TaxID=2304604 RepID=A0A6M0SGU8_9CYAN|nr:Tex family protein [Adonisia turfae]NEZ67594.1 RNA-binding transcriptional accessory protein [Adonisia turfae CCMR0082]
MQFAPVIAKDLSVRPAQVEAALELLETGATVPFIARYRKEKTGELDERQLRQIEEQFAYLTELTNRKQTVLESIEGQGKLTDELRDRIQRCTSKTELEDLYLPYRPKRRTRATIAREKGLEPLAQQIAQLNKTGEAVKSLEDLAANFITDDVPDAAAALQGASDILAEGVAEQSDLRAYVRQTLLKTGVFSSKIKPDYPEGSTKYEMYRKYECAIAKLAPHNLLALLRGDKEGILKVNLTGDEDQILNHLETSQIRTKQAKVRQFYQTLIKDAFSRLMKNSLTNEVIAEKKTWADGESIDTFAVNIKNLLLAAPAGMKPTLGVDPGFRTGCKVAAIDGTGKFLEYKAIFPHTGKQESAAKILSEMISRHNIQLIAIGNGTASRETDAFVAEVVKGVDPKPIKVMVNESGASIYSASEVAIAEFPDLDITVRGAISIARRLQDPLAELVKIEPKSIGVGQYQHDVDQKQLKQKLDATVESCVNYVGVDLNIASRELLTYVSGVSSAIANNIVAYRNENGAFNNRRQLLKVAKLGPKAYEQCAGFLRIRDGKNPLDNTAVHPESYDIATTILKDKGVDGKKGLSDLNLENLELQRYVTDAVGLPTLRDIVEELEKPGRDPRAEFTYASFQEGVNEISDLKEGMVLEGVITNVANFGAFVDIGVHQDGLVHISQLVNRFVKDPKEVVQVGQVVKVKVMEINKELKRIGLSMKAVDGGGGKAAPRPSKKQAVEKAAPKPASLADLQAKFSRPKRRK